MKIRKNGKTINLSESDMKRIVKKLLSEQVAKENIVIACIKENTTLKDIKELPEACITMVTSDDLVEKATAAVNCGLSMDKAKVDLIVSKLDPIAKCVAKKMSDSGNTTVMN